MSITINAAILSDINPYIPGADLVVVADTTKVVSGAFKPTFSSIGNSYLVAATPAIVGLLDVIFTVNHDQNVFSDSSGAVFCTAAGNGYYVAVIDNHIRVY